MEDKQVVIIGAGFSGICLGIQLQKQLKCTDFTIYDKGRGVGGTWFFNTYPGAGCDVPSHLYSYSFEPNPNWSSFWVGFEEINAYQVKVVKKYGMESRIKTRHECISAIWDINALKWIATLKNLQTNTEFKVRAKILIQATGELSIPNPFPIQAGLSDFKGHIFHTARFDHSVDIKDKHVVVVGNGCSATQMVPKLIDRAKSVTQIIRSPHYIEPLPLPNINFPSWFQFLLMYIPFLQWFIRIILYFGLDLDFLLFKESFLGKQVRKIHEKSSKRHVSKHAPEKYLHLLTPQFEYGAKRRVFDTNYLHTLHNPKLNLTNDPLIKLTKTGLVLQSGTRIRADVIVNATGFQTSKSTFPFPIIGTDAIPLKDKFKEKGASFYRGGYTSSAPNFVSLLGTNTYQGHTSVIFTAECHVTLCMQYLKKALDPLVSFVKVRQESQDAWTRFVDFKFRGLLFERKGVVGWYHSDPTKRNSVIWPGFQTEFWWYTRRIKWDDFIVV